MCVLLEDNSLCKVGNMCKRSDYSTSTATTKVCCANCVFITECDNICLHYLFEIYKYDTNTEHRSLRERLQWIVD